MPFNAHHKEHRDLTRCSYFVPPCATMKAFEIRGGKSLQGTITPQGAKNEALQVLCAALLTDEPVTYTNVPDIIDVNTLIELLEDMGVKVERPAPNKIILQANNIDPDYFTTHAFKKKSG